MGLLSLLIWIQLSRWENKRTVRIFVMLSLAKYLCSVAQAQKQILRLAVLAQDDRVDGSLDDGVKFSRV